jgi:hypothetical protein
MSKLLVTLVVVALPGIAADTLTVFLKGTSPALDSARVEVARLMQPAGFSVEWKDIAERRIGADYSRLVVVELKGVCSPGQAVGEAGSLASTAVVDGKVLPFSVVHCDSLHKAMSAANPGLKLFGRALGRVIAHELYHMLVQTKEHAATGVSKSCFGISDLMAERFDFDMATVAQLRPAEEELPAEDTGR